MNFIKYKIIKRLLLLIILSAISLNIDAQIYISGQTTFNGSSIIFNGNVIVSSTGVVTNNGSVVFNGYIQNDGNVEGPGTFNLKENWINNNSFTGTGNFILFGGNQSITGTSITTFHNLTLTGTGIKTTTLDCNISNVLDFNDIELAAGANTVYVLNPNVSSVSRTTGFFSSLNGALSRQTNSTNTYLYPLGSSSNSRYRPILIKPISASANTFKASFINHNADNDSYTRSQTDTGICNITPSFYHKVSQTAGSDSADVSIQYDEIADGHWQSIARWQNVSSNLWSKLQNITQVTASPLNTITVHHFSNLSNHEAIALARQSLTYNLGNDTGYCAGNNVIIDAGSGYASYNWSNGQSSQTITVSNSGTYYVTVSDGFCSAIDSIIVTESSHTSITLDKNKYICAGDSAMLNATSSGNFLWSNGDTTATIIVSPLSTTQYTLSVTNGYCIDTASAKVFVNPIPVANAGTNQSVCDGDTITLTANGSSNYLWSTGDTTNTIIVNPSNTTTYYVTVSDSLNCSSMDSVTVTINQVPNVTTSNDTTICSGDNINIFALGGANYLWSTGASSSTINVSPSSTTNYSVVVSNGGCSVSDSVLVDVRQLPTISITASNLNICDQDTITLTANGNAPFLWNTGDTTQNIVQFVNSASSFWVKIGDGFCTNSDTININYNISPNSLLSDKEICTSDSVNLLVNNNTNYTYSWTDSLNNMLLSNSNNPIVFPSSTSVYQVTITNSNCITIDSVTVTVHSNPSLYISQSDTTIIENTSFNLIVNTDSTNSILWQPSSYLSNDTIYNPTTSPINDIIYYVIITNSFGCKSSDSIEITIKHLEHPIQIFNTFTPNEDGTNDFFHIENIEYYPENKVTIYNRDGHIVYQRDNYENNWDGKYYGNKLPAATYYYVLEIPALSPNIYKGDITIIR